MGALPNDYYRHYERGKHMIVDYVLTHPDGRRVEMKCGCGIVFLKRVFSEWTVERA